MSYYDDLETIPSASAEEIKARWRRMSSEYHPDKKGGSVEAMQRINKAYEVLGDPERRARYDATGEGDEASSIEQEALNMLTGALRQALDTSEDDLLQVAGRVLDAVRSQLAVHCSTRQTEIKRLQKLTGRVRVKKGDNLVQGMVDARLRDATAALSQLRRGQEVNKLALEMLANYSFDAPPAAYTGGTRYSSLAELILGSLGI